jgi:hypothetical protein
MNHPDRSSRRALILQMARARMKNQGGSGGGNNTTNNITKNSTSEEKKLEHVQETTNDIDLPVDLD